MERDEHFQTEEPKKMELKRKGKEISKGCKLYLTSGLTNYPTSRQPLKAGEEIAIFKMTHNLYSSKPEESITIFYKSFSGGVTSFTCDEDLKRLLWPLEFDGKILPVSEESLEIYEKIYAAVESAGGYARVSQENIDAKRHKARARLGESRSAAKSEIKALLEPYKLTEAESAFLEDGYVRFREPMRMRLVSGINSRELTYLEALFHQGDAGIYSLVQAAYDFRIKYWNTIEKDGVGTKNVAVVCIRHSDGSVSIKPAISGGVGPPGHSERLALRDAINEAIHMRKPEFLQFNGVLINESVILDDPAIFAPYLSALQQCAQIDIFSDRGPCDHFHPDPSLTTCDVFFKHILGSLKHRFFFATPYNRFNPDGMRNIIHAQIKLFKKIVESSGQKRIDINALLEKLETKVENKKVSEPVTFKLPPRALEKNAFTARLDPSYQYTEEDMACVIRQYKDLPIFSDSVILDAISNLEGHEPFKRIIQATQSHGKIFGVFNIGNWHWTAFCILRQEDRNAATLFYKDSKGGPPPQALTDALNQMFEIIDIPPDTAIEQMDGTSCGIFALENMRVMASNLHSEHTDGYVMDFCDQGRALFLRAGEFAEDRVISQYLSLMDDALHEHMRPLICVQHQAEAEQLQRVLMGSELANVNIKILGLGETIEKSIQAPTIGIEIFVPSNSITQGTYEYSYRLQFRGMPAAAITGVLNPLSCQISDGYIDIPMSALNLAREQLIPVTMPAVDINLSMLCGALGISSNSEEQGIVQDILERHQNIFESYRNIGAGEVKSAFEFSSEIKPLSRQAAVREPTVFVQDEEDPVEQVNLYLATSGSKPLGLASGTGITITSEEIQIIMEEAGIYVQNPGEVAEKISHALSTANIDKDNISKEVNRVINKICENLKLNFESTARLHFTQGIIANLLSKMRLVQGKSSRAKDSERSDRRGGPPSGASGSGSSGSAGGRDSSDNNKRDPESGSTSASSPDRSFSGNSREKKRSGKELKMVTEASHEGTDSSSPALKCKGLSVQDNEDKRLVDFYFKQGISVGDTYDNGDCFFESISQSLGGSLSYKELRELCASYIEEDAQKADGWVKSAIAKDIKTGDSTYDECRQYIRYTTPELTRSCTWGRPNIEGRMICEKLNKSLYWTEYLPHKVCQLFYTKRVPKNPPKVDAGEVAIVIVKELGELKAYFANEDGWIKDTITNQLKSISALGFDPSVQDIMPESITPEGDCKYDYDVFGNYIKTAKEIIDSAKRADILDEHIVAIKYTPDSYVIKPNGVQKQALEMDFQEPDAIHLINKDHHFMPLLKGVVPKQSIQPSASPLVLERESKRDAPAPNQLQSSGRAKERLPWSPQRGLGLSFGRGSSQTPSQVIQKPSSAQQPPEKEPNQSDPPPPPWSPEKSLKLSFEQGSNRTPKQASPKPPPVPKLPEKQPTAPPASERGPAKKR